MKSTFIQRLHEKFQQAPLVKKVLVAPRFSDGQQWLHQVCKEYGYVLNVDVQTIESLAIKQSALKLFKQKKTYIRSGQSFWLVQQIMSEMAEEGSGYLTKEMLSPGMVACFHRAIEDLRQGIVRADELDPNQFIDSTKGQYVKDLLRRYEEMLSKFHFADVMNLVELVEKDMDGTIYIMPEDALHTKAQQMILANIAKDRLVRIEMGPSFTSVQSGFPAGEAAFFHATGNMAEVREVMRRMMSHNIKLDQVEIIASDYELYSKTIHTLATELGIACTFSGGLPLQYSRIGRSLLTMLHWLEHDFPVTDILTILRDGGLSLRQADESVRTSEWIRLMERLNIGWGKERYQLLLESSSGSEQEKSMLGTLKKVFTGLFSFVPTDDAWSPNLILKWLQSAMKKYGVIQDENDAIILNELDAMIDSLSIVGLSSTLMSKDVALHYTKQLVSGIRMNASSTPAPGAVHISSLTNGGLTGRPFTFIVGMDEHTWSVSTRQDPVLLDEERQSISDNLILSSERNIWIKRQQCSRLGTLSGNVTLSYSSYQLSEGKQASPAFEFLQIYRNQSRQQDTDYSLLQKSLGMPVSYLGALSLSKEDNVPFDASDLWATEMVDSRNTLLNGRDSLESSYPFLRNGTRAVSARISDSITMYDGRIQSESLIAEVRGRVFSASQLERYAECPMKYYFGYVLGFWPKDGADYDRTRWLEPADRGNLLHQIFYDYLKKVTVDGTQPAIHDKRLLQAITEEQIEHYKQLVPAPSPHILQKESDEIRQDVEWFYNEETRKTTLPRYFEQELSIHGESMLVTLTDGSTITLKGFIDRIDQIAPNQYRIIDYKSGSSSKYRENQHFAGGTQLQHALYAFAAEKWLKETGIDIEARVTESAYYFPTGRGIGREVVRQQNNRDELTRLVTGILSSMEKGIYIPTHDTGRCRYCDYAAVCGNHASFMEDKKANPESAEFLKSLLEVGSID